MVLVPGATVIRPAVFSDPVPSTVVFVSCSSPVELIVLVLVRVSVRPLAESVCTPLVPPSSRDATAPSMSSVTVYVPFSAMTAVSWVLGTVPVLQLVPSLQFPPSTLIQWTAPGGTRISKATLVSGVSPVAVATSVNPLPGWSIVKSVNCATPAMARSAVVPLNTAVPLGSLPMAIETVPVNPTSTLPSGSSAVTSTVASVAVAAAPTGSTLNVRLDGAAATPALKIESIWTAVSAPA